MHLRIRAETASLFAYFIGLIVVGTGLLMLPSSWSGPRALALVDAAFTATSAVCVTGLASVDTALYTRFGQAVIMLLIQFGGLGIITFATLYLATPRRRISLASRGLIRDYFVDEVDHDPKGIVRSVVGVTLAFEAAGTLLLLPAFRDERDPLFVAAFHAVSAFCNAGFSTFSTSLEAYVLDPLVNLTIAGLLVVGGIGFGCLRDVQARLAGRSRRLTTHSKIAIWASAALLLGGFAGYLLLEWSGAYRGLPLGGKLLAALFQSATPRTAGFDTVPQSALSDLAALLTMALMFVGASPASTGGGVKTTTVFLVLASAFRPGDERLRIPIGRRAVGPRLVVKALSVLVRAACIVAAAAGALALAEAQKLAAGETRLFELAFEAVSAFATAGLSLGVTGGLSWISKAVLIATMLAGRVGLFAMALPSSGRRIDRYADLPETTVLVG